MERYGLIGRPLGHSFSASFFAEKFASEGIDAVYENHELPELAGHFMELVDSTPNLRGLNVTIPYKQDVIPLLNELSDDARAIGAVNVISISRLDDGRPHLKGYNSDVIGFTESIKPLLRECHKKALVLGTGGASKAVVYGLEKLGLATTYVSRTPRSGMLTYENLSADINTSLWSTARLSVCSHTQTNTPPSPISCSRPIIFFTTWCTIRLKPCS